MAERHSTCAPHAAADAIRNRGQPSIELREYLAQSTCYDCPAADRAEERQIKKTNGPRQPVT
jgi:hypothetical protein